MKTAVAFRHVPFEDLGTLADTLHSLGYECRYIDTPVESFTHLDPQAADLLVVLGGPIGAYQQAIYPFLNEELRHIRERLAHGKPVLGICLGAQLIARALEAEVAPMGVTEIGYAPLTLTPGEHCDLLAPLADLPVLHWHGDRFAIPQGASHLARSAVCDNQAFLYAPHALALQFHPEVSAIGLEGWLVGHASELSHAGIDPRQLREQAAQYSPALAAALSQVISRWLAPLAS